jgi:hypothetical protein
MVDAPYLKAGPHYASSRGYSLHYCAPRNMDNLNYGIVMIYRWTNVPLQSTVCLLMISCMKNLKRSLFSLKKSKIENIAKSLKRIKRQNRFIDFFGDRVSTSL